MIIKPDECIILSSIKLVIGILSQKNTREDAAESGKPMPILFYKPNMLGLAG